MDDAPVTAEVAFAVLMRKVREKDAELAARVQAAVDAGKDVEETEPFPGGRKEKLRSYRKTIPYSYKEGFQVALDALAAYFVEQPLFINSSLDNIAQAALERPNRLIHNLPADKRPTNWFAEETKGREKPVEVEVRLATQISQPTEETFTVRRVPQEQLQEQQRNLNGLLIVLASQDR
jgi:hypothetical protein